MSDLINLRLDIFAYQHRGGLGDSQESILKNSQHFWDSFPPEFPNDLKISLKQEDFLDSSEYGELLKLTKTSKPYYFFCTKNKSDKEIKTLYYPVRLHDTYGLAFGCGIDSQHEALPIEYFAELKRRVPNCLLRQSDSVRFRYNYIGKTWMLSGCISSNSSKSEEDIAQSICKELDFCQEWSIAKSEKFLGATMFEVSLMPQQWNRLEENHHILIFLYHDPETMDLVSEKFYVSWMRLFCYRNKIIWAYWQAQKDIDWLKENFFSLNKVRKNPAINSLVVDKKKEINEKYQAFNLEILQEALQDNSLVLHNYVKKLGILKIHQQTIETDINNYNKRLCTIKDKAIKLQLKSTETNLLESFSKIVAQRYKEIVKIEYTSLRPGLSVIENLTQTLRGCIQIQQAEIDRNLEVQNSHLVEQNANLQNGLAIAGTGIGAASVTASASAGFVGEIVKTTIVKNFPSKIQTAFVPSLSIVATLFISFCMGLFWSFAIWLWLSKKNRSKNS